MAQEEGNAGDIIVTARRVEERLQDVPISMTVFNQTQITERNVVKAEDLARFTPSLAANSNFGSDNSTFAVRGFVQDIGTGPSVGVYFADVVAPRGGNPALPTGDGAGPGSFFDLQNVQVLKGPQGTLFGRNTTGGAVILVPQRPTDVFEGYVEGSIGNYDLRRVEAVVNIPLADTFRVRLGMDRQKRDGWLRNRSGIGPDDFADVDYLALRGSIVAELTPTLENYTVVSYSRSNTNGPLQKLTDCNPASFIYGAFACPQLMDAAAKAEGFYDVRSSFQSPGSRLASWQISNTLAWNATDRLTIKNIASYGQLKQNMQSALFGTQFYSIPVAGEPARPFPFSAFSPSPDAKGVAYQSTFTEELQFQGRSGDNRLTWQAGLYYERASPLGPVGSMSPTSLYCTDVQALQCTDVLGLFLTAQLGFPVQVGTVNYNRNRLITQSIGSYLQASYEITDQIKVTGGLRYTWDLQRSSSSQIAYSFAPVAGGGLATHYCPRPTTELPQCALDLEQKSSAPTWLVGLDFKPTDDVLLYAKYARGYRTGGIKPDAPVQYQRFRPEKVDTFEVGAKASFNGAVRGNFNISAFYNDFADQQIQVGFGDNQAVAGTVAATTGPVNAGKSRIYGVEVEAALRPVAGLSLNASYAYLNTRIKSITAVTLPANDPYIVGSAVIEGDRLALTPTHKLVLSGAYTLPLGRQIGEISFGATYSYTGAQRASYASRDPASIALLGRDIGIIAPINLVSLNAGWKSIADTPVDLTAFVTNLTKERYFTYVTGLWSSTGFETATLGEPRMYGARLRYSF
ncbi:TonB-dependent receptor [Novosphingobium kaempferiae]|uniref:TonB-dependent receptor n=1 Tax=Novosphingobium kaempferiae TaxID=2896849 RepID=UPI001E4E405A|nr:TonB-dependent receptor [Novosphingobium kaempferiae]